MIEFVPGVVKETDKFIIHWIESDMIVVDLQYEPVNLKETGYDVVGKLKFASMKGFCLFADALLLGANDDLMKERIQVVFEPPLPGWKS